MEDTTGLQYNDAYKYGAYFAGWGAYGNGSYFAYGKNALDESRGYGPSRVYGLVRPSDMRNIHIDDLKTLQQNDILQMRADLAKLDRDSEEAQALYKKYKLYQSGLGEYAAAKGYDAITVPKGNYTGGRTRPVDDDLKGDGYIVVLNRGSTIVVDENFTDREDIFTEGLPEGLADSAIPPPLPDGGTAPGDGTVDPGVAGPAAPGVV